MSGDEALSFVRMNEAAIVVELQKIGKLLFFLNFCIGDKIPGLSNGANLCSRLANIKIIHAFIHVLTKLQFFIVLFLTVSQNS